MKILIDNSILNAGGGIQVAISFLNDLKDINLLNEYYVLQSPFIIHSIVKSDFPHNFHFIDMPDTDHSSLLKRIKFTKNVENSINPDAIFTVFGPSYHKSKFPKVVGFAIPYIIYFDSPFFKKTGKLSYLKYKMMSVIKTYCFKKYSDAIIFETDDARNIFYDNNLINNSLFTVGNTLNSIFDNDKLWKKLVITKSEFDILCLSANYPHKNLDIIPRVIDCLVNIMPNSSFKFHISAEKKDFNFNDKYNKYINYLGKIPLDNVPTLYQQMDVLFMPTLLEVFSTTYLEAMFMKVPIVCSDMGFARDICADAALFCTPLDAQEYAINLHKVFEIFDLRNSLVEKGKINLRRFGNSMDRTQEYLKIIENTANNAKN